MAAVAGVRCAGSEYKFYNADAPETLKMELSVCCVFRFFVFSFLDSTAIKLQD
jgi:hypothetical protein